MGLVAKGTNQVTRGLELSAPAPWTLRWGVGLGIELITNSQWLDPTCLVRNPLWKHQVKGFRVLRGWWMHPRGRRVAHPKLQRNRSSYMWGPCGPCLCTSLFVWLSICNLCNILYNKLVIVSKVFPWIPWTITANYQTWSRDQGNPPICSQGRQKYR